MSFVGFIFTLELIVVAGPSAMLSFMHIAIGYHGWRYHINTGAITLAGPRLHCHISRTSIVPLHRFDRKDSRSRAWITVTIHAHDIVFRLPEHRAQKSKSSLDACAADAVKSG